MSSGLDSGTLLIGATIGAQPAGVALKLRGCSDDFDVVLLDAGGAAMLTFGPFSEEDVVAIWRRLASAGGLPLLVQLATGLLQISPPQIGRVVLGPIRIRRRHALLNGRRPRFLVRRKTGRLPTRPQIHREREIIAGQEM